jgi:hypothetical protein
MDDINSKFFNSPFKVTSAGGRYGSSGGGVNCGSTDSVVISGAERQYTDNIFNLQQKLNTIESDIQIASMDLDPKFAELIGPGDQEKAKKQIEQLEKQKEQVTKEIASSTVDQGNFARTKIVGSWGKEDCHINFTDDDNTPNLNVGIKLDDNTHIPSLVLENKGKSGKEDDLVGLNLPLTDRELKNTDTLNTALNNMPAQVKSVEVDKTHGFLSHKTVVNITGDKGEKFSLEINNGKIKK